MSIEELELMSYTDITYLLLKDNNKAMNTATLFKKICDLLGLTDDDFTNKIGDYYTSLTIDKRFYLLDDALWDLSEKHKVLLQLDDDDSELEEESLEQDEDKVEDNEESLDDNLDVMDDDLDDDTLDLSIVTDDELEEDN